MKEGKESMLAYLSNKPGRSVLVERNDFNFQWGAEKFSLNAG